MRRSWLVAFAAVAVVALAGTAYGAPETIRLRFGSVFPPPPALDSLAIPDFQKLVTERTKGRVQFQNFFGGVLFKTDDLVQAMSDGRVDVMYYPSVFGPGRAPMAPFQQWFPFGPSDPELMLKMRHQIDAEFPQLAQELERLGGIAIGYSPLFPMEVISKKPIRTAEDFKGKRMASIGLELGEMAKALGATGVSMYAGERYVAFETGVLDGAFEPMQMSFSFKHYEVLKHLTLLGIQGAHLIHVVVHKPTWEKLSPDIQKIMRDAAREASFGHAKRLKTRREEMLNLWRQRGGDVYVMPEKEKRAIAGRFPDLPAQWAANMDGRGLPGSKIARRWKEIGKDNGWEWIRDWCPKC